MRKKILLILGVCLFSFLFTQEAKSQPEGIINQSPYDSSQDAVGDFFALQYTKQKNFWFHQYLGGYVDINFGFSNSFSVDNPFSFGSGIGLSYLAVFGMKKTPILGLEGRVGFFYTAILHPKAGKPQILNPILSPYIRIFLYSPAYIAIGANIGINVLRHEENSFYVGPSLKVGFLEDVGKFAFDIALVWSYFPKEADPTTLYGLLKAADWSQTFGLSFTFYGLL